jgi:hypothetical protein
MTLKEIGDIFAGFLLYRFENMWYVKNSTLKIEEGDGLLFWEGGGKMTTTKSVKAKDNEDQTSQMLVDYRFLSVAFQLEEDIERRNDIIRHALFCKHDELLEAGISEQEMIDINMQYLALKKAEKFDKLQDLYVQLLKYVSYDTKMLIKPVGKQERGNN